MDASVDNSALDLLELQQMIAGGLSDLFPGKLRVRAEIASMQVRGGHCYMELSQSGPDGLVAKVRAVSWRSWYQPLAAYFLQTTGSPLAAGMSVLLEVQVSYSELYGLSLLVYGIEPLYTMGEAERRRLETISRLEAEGLLDRQKELAVSPLPYRLAVISSPDAAGYGDFTRHLAGNEYGFVFDTELYEALMQGESAPASIIAALHRVAAASEAGEEIDAVLLLRGGGSTLDLVCFDDYELCRAIALFPLPVYTAIGHDRDRHVADMVAYEAVKTPTALADGMIDAFAAEDERIGSYATRLRLAFVSRLAEMSSALDRLEQRIHAADPRALLSRGYSLVAGPSGAILKSASAVRPGDRLRILFADGEIIASVEDSSPEYPEKCGECPENRDIPRKKGRK